jgi:hypothetical protein
MMVRDIGLFEPGIHREQRVLIRIARAWCTPNDADTRKKACLVRQVGRIMQTVPITILTPPQRCFSQTVVMF